MKLKQHALSALVPRLTNEEVGSILLCEGAVQLSDKEKKTITSSAWFLALPPRLRASIVVSVYEWRAQGSNQYQTKTTALCPSSAARIARDVINKAMTWKN